MRRRAEATVIVYTVTASISVQDEVKVEFAAGRAPVTTQQCRRIPKLEEDRQGDLTHKHGWERERRTTSAHKGDSHPTRESGDNGVRGKSGHVIGLFHTQFLEDDKKKTAYVTSRTLPQHTPCAAFDGKVKLEDIEGFALYDRFRWAKTVAYVNQMCASSIVGQASSTSHFESRNPVALGKLLEVFMQTGQYPLDYFLNSKLNKIKLRGGKTTKHFGGNQRNRGPRLVTFGTPKANARPPAGTGRRRNPELPTSYTLILTPNFTPSLLDINPPGAPVLLVLVPFCLGKGYGINGLEASFVLTRPQSRTISFGSRALRPSSRSSPLLACLSTILGAEDSVSHVENVTSNANKSRAGRQATKHSNDTREAANTARQQGYRAHKQGHHLKSATTAPSTSEGGKWSELRRYHHQQFRSRSELGKTLELKNRIARNSH
ncbi:hypothetical protein LTR37_007876 [Vermiconidia calcicola]|uniref:Uncharacterized protein n=1 Tax=Vermiconidia calcicola TaxID=1690605 RepID=A0ACC3NCP3_9PEZI|nr:hypothetical protein LTR37_007876 [Vermiconidia calcicola]